MPDLFTYLSLYLTGNLGKIFYQSPAIGIETYHISPNTDKIIPHFIKLVQIFGSTCGSRKLAVFPGYIGYILSGLHQSGMRPFPGSAYSLTEIPRTKKQHIESIQGG